MRFSLSILTAIIVSALLITGFAIIPYQAAARDLHRGETNPVTPPATMINDTTTFSNYPLQPSYLTLTVTTDKAVYLSGEVVNITVSTNTINTHVSLMAQLPSGSLQPIENFTLNYSHTLSWTAPDTSGQIRITCSGEAQLEIWDYCTRYVCIGPGDTDCHWDSYPCLRTIPVTGNAYNDISVFSRTTSISGRVIDTNQSPVAEATVAVLSTGQSSMSDNNGNYQIIYQLGNNYALVNGTPTMTDTLTVDAVACEPQPGKSVQIQAGLGASQVNFTLNRVFFPPDLDSSEFTYAAFSGWTPAKDFATWQNIAGIMVDGQVQVTKLQYETTEISPQFFDFGNKRLYLITTPAPGHYLLDIQGTPNSQYKVAAAATANGSYLQPVTVNTAIGPNGSQRLRFTLQQNQIQLQVLNPFPALLIIIPVVTLVLGSLVAAYFLTGGNRRWGKVFARRNPKTEIATTTQPASKKAIVKSTVKGSTRRTSKIK